MKTGIGNFTLFTLLAASLGSWAQAMGKSPDEIQQINQDIQTITNNQATLNQLRSALQLATESSPPIANDATDADLKAVIQQQTNEMTELQDRQEIQNNDQMIAAEETLLQVTPEQPTAVPQNPTIADLVTLLEKQHQKIAELKKEQEQVNEQFDSTLGISETASRNPLFDTNHYEQTRCRDLHDSLPNSQVEGRNKWAKTCFVSFVKQVVNEANSPLALQDKTLDAIAHELVGEQTALLSGADRAYNGPQVFYPSFGKVNPKTGQIENPLNLVAPVNSTDSCAQSYATTTNDNGVSGAPAGVDLFKAGYHLVAMCVSGCYAPEQRLLFKNGYEEIADAFDRKDLEIQTLTSDSTREKLKYQVSELAYYTIDTNPSWQTVYDIETLSGKKLTVTTNHALMSTDGFMRTADQFKQGDNLVQADGSPDPILKIDSRQYFGKVYNVQPKTENALENIVVAEGLLTGSVYYQNLGVRDLNRDLFRINLPSQLIQ